MVGRREGYKRDKPGQIGFKMRPSIVSALRSPERLTMVLADCYQVNYAERFAPIRPGEAQQMPARPRLVSESLNAILGHAHTQCSLGRNFKTSHIFWISFRGCHWVLRLTLHTASA